VRKVTGGLFEVAIKLTHGEVVKLPLSVRLGGPFSSRPHPLDEWCRDPAQVVARRRALTAQIETALTHFRSAGGDSNAETVARLLDRDARPIREWQTLLSQARGDSYRERRLDADQLLNVLENPRIPLGQRLGAALALAGDRDDAAAARERRSRVQAAIASSANPRVRIALERAAEGSLDDDTFDRALAAEAEARRIKA
jgi:hypothetical protein